MTKLEELKAAYDDAYDAAHDAWAARDTSCDDAYAAWAWAAYETAYMAAWDAYKAELKKTQEENRMTDELTEVGGDGIRRSFDEHYDSAMDVREDPTGAMWAIYKQARRIEELEAEIVWSKND